MTGAKIYNGINGVFYLLYGLFGTFFAARIADMMGWEPSLLGLHEVRAIWMACAGLGAIILFLTFKKPDLQAGLTLGIVAVTLSFAAGRVLALVLDGAGPTLTYQELGFEIFWAIVGVWVYSRAKRAEAA